MNMRVNPHIVALGLALEAPSLEGLAMALRDRSTWPAGFEWDFLFCENCAMGLANALWNIQTDDNPVSDMASAMGISSAAARSLFYDADWLRPVPRRIFGIQFGTRTVELRDVTPEMVAAAIDAYLARQP